jgi:cyclase
VRSVEDVDQLLRAGADKCGINTAAISRPEVITEIAERFGNQVLVLAADVRRVTEDTPDGPARSGSGFEVTTHGGRRGTGIDALAWIREATDRGAGEILLNSMDADGTKVGFDLELIRLARETTNLPLIASGGAGAVSDFAPAVQVGADAVLAASVFHFGEITIGEVKTALADKDLPVR